MTDFEHDGPTDQIVRGFKRGVFALKIKPDASDEAMEALSRALIKGIRALEPGQRATIQFLVWPKP